MVFSTKLFLVSALFLSVFSLSFVGRVFSWDDCSKGLVNDLYPGECPRYIDTDENGICDHSEPASEDRVENSTTESTQAFKSDTETDVNEEMEVEEVKVIHETQDIQNVKKDKTFLNKILGIFAIVIPLISFIGYAGYKKHKVGKKI